MKQKQKCELKVIVLAQRLGEGQCCALQEVVFYQSTSVLKYYIKVKPMFIRDSTSRLTRHPAWDKAPSLLSRSCFLM